MDDKLPTDWVSNLRGVTSSEKDRVAIVRETLLKESDRGCAIFGAAILHDDLEDLLRAFFRTDEDSVKRVVDPLFQTYAPLSTFSSRIQIAFALKLITKDLKYRLDIIRRLRNDFAHESGPIDFDGPGLRDRLSILIDDGKPPEKIIEDSEPILIGNQILTPGQFVNRVAFIIAVSVLSARIHFLTDVAKAGKDVRMVAAALEEKGK
jgi:DNA-binding MltR family transcriptional regulator